MDENEIKIGERYDARGEVVTRAEETDRPRVVRFRASTPDKDRHRSRILPEGIDIKNFKKNPIFLWGHDGYGGWEIPKMEHVLGRVIDFEQDKKAFDIDVEFLTAEVNPLAEMGLGMIKAGALNTVSIGFIPREIKLEKDTDGGDRDVPIIVKSELLEVSLVPIPSNPNAVAIARAMVASELRTHRDVALRWSCAHGCGHDTMAEAEACKGTGRRSVEGMSSIKIGDIEISGPAKDLPAIMALMKDKVAAPPASAADNGVDEKTVSALRIAVNEWHARYAFARVLQ